MISTVVKGLYTMRNIYVVDQYQYIHNQHYFSLNDNDQEIQIQPGGQVLADSDQLAFIYVVEEGEGYSYLSFPKQVWNVLVDIVKSKEDPYLQLGSQTIKLNNFSSELEMLVFNIEGNGNYGNEFVQAVEEQFKEVLAD